MANVITTLLKVDATQLKTGFKQAQQSIKETEGVIGKARAGISGMFAAFTSSPLAVAGATAAVGAFTSKAISDASNLEESINAVNVAYGNSARGVQALGEDSVESFGLSQRAFNEFATRFSGFADQIAASSGRQIVSVVDEITTRVADFASVFNLDVAEAARIFQASLAGETEALRRFGGDVSAAAVEQFALRTGLIETKDQLTESIKVTARYGLLMEETEKVAGDFANTQDSLANRLKTGAAGLEDFSAAVGRKLVPALADAIGIAENLNNVLDDIGRHSPGGGEGTASDALTGLISPGAALGATLEQAERFTGFLDRALGDAAGSAGTFRLAVDQLNAQLGLTPDALEAAAAGVAETADEIVDFGDKAANSGPKIGDMARALEAVDEAAQEAADEGLAKVEAAINAVADAVDERFTEVRDNLDLQDLLDDITDQFDEVAEAQKKITEDGDEGVRNYNRSVRDLRRQILELLDSIDNIPPDKKVRIAGEIETASIDNLFRILGELSRGVTVPVNFATAPTPGFESANVNFNPAAGTVSPVINQAAIPSGPMTVDSRTIINNYPVGTTPTTQYQNGVLDRLRNGERTSL